MTQRTPCKWFKKEKTAITALSQQRDSNSELIIFVTLYFLERIYKAKMVKKIIFVNLRQVQGYNVILYTLLCLLSFQIRKNTLCGTLKHMWFVNIQAHTI